MNYEALIEARVSRSYHQQDRALARREKLEAAAAPLVGELQGEKGHRFYVNLRPLHKGKIREFATFTEAIEFLVRNRYV